MDIRYSDAIEDNAEFRSCLASPIFRGDLDDFQRWIEQVSKAVRMYVDDFNRKSRSLKH